MYYNQPMSKLTEIATDARQTPQWATYMQKIGWIVEKANGINVFVRQVKPFKHSIIKIQHPKGPLPLDQFEAIAKKHHALFILLEPHPQNYDETFIASHGFKKSKQKTGHSSTILIDLEQNEEALLNSFSENARRNIKKAISNNITVKHIYYKGKAELSHFNEFFTLMQNVSHIKKFYIPPYEEMLDKINAFKGNSLLSFAYAPGKTEPIAAVWYAYFDQTLAYLHTGITKEGYDTMANYLLVWEGLKQGQQLQMKVFDFEALYDKRYRNDQKKWKGFTEFKKRFHGEIIEFPSTWIKIYNVPYKLLYLCSTIFTS